MFRRNLSVPSSRVKRADCLTLETKTDRLCRIPEPSVRNYHCTLRLVPKECRFHLHREGSLKSRILLRTAPSDVPRADHRAMLCLQVTRLRPFVILRRVILTGWLVRCIGGSYRQGEIQVLVENPVPGPVSPSQISSHIGDRPTDTKLEIVLRREQTAFKECQRECERQCKV